MSFLLALALAAATNAKEFGGGLDRVVASASGRCKSRQVRDLGLSVLSDRGRRFRVDVGLDTGAIGLVLARELRGLPSRAAWNR